MFGFEAISVAPMEGFTTFPLRLFLTMTSAPQKMTTPFLKVTRTFPLDEIPRDFAPELYELREVFAYELVPQFIAGEVECFLRAADLIPGERAPVIEFNCGCPSPNSMGKFAGSGILQDPDYFQEALGKIARALGPERTAIKMRIGVLQEEEFPRLLDTISEFSLARLTIHGRTKKAGYRGSSNWSSIEDAAMRFQGRVPVLGSGDVDSFASLEAFRQAAPSASGLMIGRGVLKNPWVFEELKGQKTVLIPSESFLLALYAYLLIQDLWQREPYKLIARLQKGRIGAYAGLSEKAWEQAAVDLSTLALGLPLLPFGDRDIAVSPVAFDRLKILWTYLRGSMPEDLRVSVINKTRNPREFFTALHESLGDYGEILPLEIVR